MNNFDLNLLSAAPKFECKLKLHIDPIVPLSLCDRPGHTYVSSVLPSRGKIYGLLENALGCHYHIDVRRYILNRLFGED